MNNFKLNLKKSILIAVTGAFAVTGFAAYTMPQTSFAETQQEQQNDQQRPPKLSPEQAADRISSMTGVDKQTLLNYCNNGWKMHDLDRAATLACASGKSIDDVIAAKTASNNWRDVANTLGVTRDQMHMTMQNFHAKQIAEALKIDADKVKKLLNTGYRPHDIAMAAALADKSGKSIDAVLKNKMINNTWKSVAADLGIDEAAFNECRDTVRNSMPSPGGNRGFHHGPQMRDGQRGQFGGGHHNGPHYGNPPCAPADNN